MLRYIDDSTYLQNVFLTTQAERVVLTNISNIELFFFRIWIIMAWRYVTTDRSEIKMSTLMQKGDILPF